MGVAGLVRRPEPHPWRWFFRHYLRLYDVAFVGCVLLETAVGITSQSLDLWWPWVLCLTVAQIAIVTAFTLWRRKVGRDRYGLDF